MVALSCVQCKNRKVKCNKERPTCSNCSRRNSACEYPKTFRSIPLENLHERVYRRLCSHESTDKVNKLKKSRSSDSPPNSNIPSSSSSPNSPVLSTTSTTPADLTTQMEKVLPTPLPSLVDTNPLASRIRLTSNGFMHSSSSRYYGFNSAADVSTAAQHTLLSNDLTKPEALHSFPLIDGEFSLSDTQKLILNCFSTYKNIASSSLSGDVLDPSHFSNDLLYQGLSTLKFRNEVLLTIYAILVFCSRHMNDFPPKLLNTILKEFPKLATSTEDCPEKISAQLLLAEHHYCQYRSEESWNLLFSIVCSCYRLGIHVANQRDVYGSKLWTKVVLLDCLICSTIGRPSAISSFINTKPTFPDCRGVMYTKILKMFRDGNDLFQHFNCSDDDDMAYDKVLALDNRYDTSLKNITAMIKDNNELHHQEMRVLLIANQIKLHYPFILDHSYSQFKLMEVLKTFFNYIPEFISRIEKLYGQQSRFRQLYPVVSCFIFQDLAILLACFKKYKNLIPQDLQNDYFSSFQIFMNNHKDFLSSDYQVNQIMDTLNMTINNTAAPPSPTATPLSTIPITANTTTANTGSFPVAIENDASFLQDDPLFFQVFYSNLSKLENITSPMKSP